MGIIAAIYWDSSTKHKSLSYMIIDSDNSSIRFGPKKNVFSTRFEEFQIQAEKAIQKFFNEIVKIYTTSHLPMTIEFKIVSHAADSLPFYGINKLPSEETVFIRDRFTVHFIKTREQIKDIKLAAQWRSRLSGNALKDFKKGLKELNLIVNEKKDAYRWHLWALALHATQGSFEQKLQKLRNIILPSSVQTNDVKRGTKSRRHA